MRHILYETRIMRFDWRALNVFSPGINTACRGDLGVVIIRRTHAPNSVRVKIGVKEGWWSGNGDVMIQITRPSGSTPTFARNRSSPFLRKVVREGSELM